MSAPNGFDATATALPGGGQIPSTPIHVQQGGGMVGGSDDILKDFGIGTGGIIDDLIDEPTKKAFLEQYKTGVCSADSGVSIILRKDCWAISAVIRALIKRNLNDYNSETPNLANKPSNNGLGNNPLSAITVNAEPNRVRGNGLGNNPLSAITVNTEPNKPYNNALGNNPLSAITVNTKPKTGGFKTRKRKNRK